jgi:hypothetical protein
MPIRHGSSRYDPAAPAANEAGLVSQIYLDARRLARENGTTPSNILFELRLASIAHDDEKTVAVLDRAINLMTLDKALDEQRSEARSERRRSRPLDR